MKRYLLGIFAIVFAVGLSAFTQLSNQVDEQLWYTLDPNGSPTNASDYSPTPGNVRICFADDEICGVKARQGTPGHPDLSDPNLQFEKMPSAR